MITEIPCAFKVWIANFKNADLPIGDFAKDILSDKDFPKSEKAIYGYLASKHADMKMFDAIWEFYLKTK